MIWLLAGALQFAVFWGSLNFKIPPLHEPNCKDLWCLNTQQLRFAPTCQDREDILGERYRCKFLKTDFGSSNINMARNNSLYYYLIRNQSRWYSWFSASRMDDLECGQSQTSVIQWTWRVKKGEEDQKGIPQLLLFRAHLNRLVSTSQTSVRVRQTYVPCDSKTNDVTVAFHLVVFKNGVKLKKGENE